MSRDYTQAEVENVMRIVRREVLPRWADNEECDDILATGYLKAWRSYCRVKDTGACKATTAAFYAARSAGANWFRSWRGDSRAGPVPVVYSLEALRHRFSVSYDPDDWHEDWAERYDPREPDHAPAVLDRLEVEGWLASLPERQRWVIERHFWDGWTLRECAECLGVCFERAVQLQEQGLRRIRKQLGLPSRLAERKPNGRRYAEDTPERRANRERVAAYRARCRK